MIEKNLSPLKQKQEYIWFANYTDGTTIYEFDENKKETSFYDINQHQVQTYGILGNGLRLSFDKESGIFNINNKEYPVTITVNNIKIKLNQSDKKLVHFKLGHTDAMIISNKVDRYIRAIDGYFFGYRLTYDKLNIQIIFGVPVAGEDRRPFFGVKASSPLNSQIKIQIGSHNKILFLNKNKTKTTNIFL